MELSKSDFAAHIGVSAGRVSQMLTDGTIGADALVGAGRYAKIDVDRAVAQIALRRDPGQALGNGIGTRLFQDEPPTPGPRPLTRSDDVALQIQQERLDSDRRKNRLAAQDELVRQGQLVPADQVRSQMTKLAKQVDEANGAMLADFATAIAGQFELPQRDVLHLLRKVRSEKKAIEAARAKARIGDVPETVELVVEAADA